MRLNIKALTLTSALICGFCILFLGWRTITSDSITKKPRCWEALTADFNINPVGGVIGLLLALADGATVGGIFAKLYR